MISLIFQFYDPHPNICRMKQYECCKNFHNRCPLYHSCKDLNGYKKASKACKKDCANCSYKGCSLTMEKRKSEPLYVNGLITVQPLPLDKDFVIERERTLWKKTHKVNYDFYNWLWGNRKEYNKKYIEQNREKHNEYAKKYYKTHYASPKGNKKAVSVTPKCELKCFECPYEDCILPENWLKKAYQEEWKKNNPTYFEEYRENNRELLREKGRKYYDENREEILARQKVRRAKPEVKAQRAEYDKRYRELHPEKEREKHHRYYEKHKDEINAKKRERRALERTINYG